MRFVRATVVVIASVLLAGCFATNTPTVGTIASCGPALDAAACRNIAQVALNAYQGAALSADKLSVDVWASCTQEGVVQISPEAATNGVTCYGVTALAASSGGRRVAEGVYDGGNLVNIESVVWADAAGHLHAVTRIAR